MSDNGENKAAKSDGNDGNTMMMIRVAVLGAVVMLVSELFVAKVMYHTKGEIFGWVPYQEVVLGEVNVHLEEFKTGGYMATVDLTIVEHVGGKPTSYIEGLCRVEPFEDGEKTHFKATSCLPIPAP